LTCWYAISPGWLTWWSNYQGIFFLQALCRKEVLLAGAEIGEDLEGIVVRHLRHGERFELADKNGPDGNTLPSNRLREDCLAGDTVCIDV